MNTVFIYALNCPTTGQTRYVGKASNPKGRLKQHLREKSRCHRTSWIRSLLGAGRLPVLEILDEVPELEWQSWEAAYIQFFRESGFDLVNSTSGGAGVEATNETRVKMGVTKIGKPLSVEQRTKISIALTGQQKSVKARTNMSLAARGKRKSPEHCEKLRAANLGKKHSDEARVKIRAAGLGRACSAETRAKIRAAQIGKGKSEEACAKMRAAHLGKKLSEETRRKQSESLKRYWKNKSL